MSFYLGTGRCRSEKGSGSWWGVPKSFLVLERGPDLGQCPPESVGSGGPDSTWLRKHADGAAGREGRAWVGQEGGARHQARAQGWGGGVCGRGGRGRAGTVQRKATLRSPGGRPRTCPCCLCASSVSLKVFQTKNQRVKSTWWGVCAVGRCRVWDCQRLFGAGPAAGHWGPGGRADSLGSSIPVSPGVGSSNPSLGDSAPRHLLLPASVLFWESCLLAQFTPEAPTPGGLRLEAETSGGSWREVLTGGPWERPTAEGKGPVRRGWGAGRSPAGRTGLASSGGQKQFPDHKSHDVQNTAAVARNSRVFLSSVYPLLLCWAGLGGGPRGSGHGMRPPMRPAAESGKRIRWATPASGSLGPTRGRAGPQNVPSLPPDSPGGRTAPGARRLPAWPPAAARPGRRGGAPDPEGGQAVGLLSRHLCPRGEGRGRVCHPSGSRCRGGSSGWPRGRGHPAPTITPGGRSLRGTGAAPSQNSSAGCGFAVPAGGGLTSQEGKVSRL